MSTRRMKTYVVNLKRRADRRARMERVLPATWDVQFTEADAQGRFGFRGVPSDELDLSVSIRGYKLSHKTHGMENAGKWALSFPVAAGNTDVNGLELLFEPGQPW